MLLHPSQKDVAGLGCTYGWIREYPLFTFWYLPHPYSGNKISTFNGLLGGCSCKIFIPKEFAAESRQQRTYGSFLAYFFFFVPHYGIERQRTSAFFLDFLLEK
jgi:hypothetical protein